LASSILSRFPTVFLCFLPGGSNSELAFLPLVEITAPLVVHFSRRMVSRKMLAGTDTGTHAHTAAAVVEASLLLARSQAWPLVVGKGNELAEGEKGENRRRRRRRCQPEPAPAGSPAGGKLKAAPTTTTSSAPVAVSACAVSALKQTR